MGDEEKESGVDICPGTSEAVGTAAGGEEKESGVDPGTGTSEPVGAAGGAEKVSGVDPRIGTSEPGGAATRGGEDDEEGEEELGVELAAGSVPVFVVSEPGDLEEAGVRPGSGLGFMEDENRFVVATSKEVEGSTSSFDKMLGSPPPTAT